MATLITTPLLPDYDESKVDWRTVAYRLAYSPDDPEWPVLLDHWARENDPLPTCVGDPPLVDAFTMHSVRQGSGRDAHTIKICYGLESFYEFTLETVDVYRGRVSTESRVSGKVIPQPVESRGEWFTGSPLSLGNPAIARTINALEWWLVQGKYEDL